MSGRLLGGASIGAGGPAGFASLGGGPSVAAAAAAAFDPSDIASLYLWAKNSTLVAGAAATWADSSGNGNTLTVVGSPVVAADAQYGGLLAMPFDGATQYLVSAGALTWGPFTLFMVCRVTAAGWMHYRSTDLEATYASTGVTLYVSRGGTASAYDDAAGANWNVTAAPRTIVHSFGGTHAGHLSRANGAARTLANQGAADPGVATSASITGFFATNAGTTKCTGTIAEILVYDAQLTTPEIEDVEAYLQAKFGHY
jgi:hypothetical protein